MTVDAFLDLPVGAAKIEDGRMISYTNRTLIRAWAEQIGGAHRGLDDGRGASTPFLRSRPSWEQVTGRRRSNC